MQKPLQNTLKRPFIFIITQQDIIFTFDNSIKIKHENQIVKLSDFHQSAKFEPGVYKWCLIVILQIFTYEKDQHHIEFIE